MKQLKQLINYFLNKNFIYNIVKRFLSEEKKERIEIEKLRNELSFLGLDTLDITDEEIKDCILWMGELQAQCGVSAKECVDVLNSFGKVLKNS